MKLVNAPSSFVGMRRNIQIKCVHCQPVPKAELIPLARMMCCLPDQQLLLCVRDSSPSLLRLLCDNRSDGRQKIFLSEFEEYKFLQFVRHAHQCCVWPSEGGYFS